MIEVQNKLESTQIGELRDWLEKHHATEKVAWVVCSKRKLENRLYYIDVVEQCLCYGWIDSTLKPFADKLVLQRISPRTKKGNWTELNKMRVKRLERLELMTAAGRAVLPCLETFVILPQILEQLQADPLLWDNFSKLPEVYKRIRIGNIQAYYIEKPTQKWHFDARDTYEKRLQKFIENTRAGILYGDWHDGGRLLEEES